ELVGVRDRAELGLVDLVAAERVELELLVAERLARDVVALDGLLGDLLAGDLGGGVAGAAERGEQGDHGDDERGRGAAHGGPPGGPRGFDAPPTGRAATSYGAAPMPDRTGSLVRAAVIPGRLEC